MMKHFTQTCEQCGEQTHDFLWSCVSRKIISIDSGIGWIVLVIMKIGDKPVVLMANYHRYVHLQSLNFSS